MVEPSPTSLRQDRRVAGEGDGDAPRLVVDGAGITINGCSVDGTLNSKYSASEFLGGDRNIKSGVWANVIVDGTAYTLQADKYITSVADLKSFRDAVNAGDNYKGKIARLVADLDLNNEDWTPIGTDKNNVFAGTFDGGNHTVKNITINRPESDILGLFGYLTGLLKNVNTENVNITGVGHLGGVVGLIFTGNIENLHAKNVTIRGAHYIGGIAGWGYTNITNCSIEDADLLAVPNADGDSYDNGDKVGGIIGQICERGYKAVGLSAKNVKARGYRDVGGLVGSTHANTIQGDVDGVEIIIDKLTNPYGKADENGGELVGRQVESGAVISGNVTNSSVTVIK